MSGQSWQEITPPRLDGATIQAVAFLDAQQGWLVGSRLDESGQMTYTLAQTADGGSTWRVKPLALFEAGDRRSLAGALYLHLLDPQTGWLVVEQATGSNFSLGALFQTSDGGDTWTRLTIPIGEPVTFVTREIGWTAGGPAGDQLYRSQDGGQTWLPQAVGGPSDRTGRRLYQLPTFDNPRKGVLPVIEVSDGEALVEFYTTADGGQSWNLATRVPLSQEIAPGTHVPVSVVDGRHWVLNLPPSRRLLHISDRGAVVTVAGQYPLLGSIGELDMATPQVGWATVVAGDCTPGAQPGNDPALPPSETSPCRLNLELVRTQDGGNTWNVLSWPRAGSPKEPIPATPDSAPGDSGALPELGSRTERFVGQGFDKCEIPTLGQLQTWISSSPYDAVNVYIGGSCRGCPNLGLTAAFLTPASQQGWRFIPTWVGPQSACWGGGCSSRISNDPSTAYNQGLGEADAALAVAINLGLAAADGSGTILYYDLEGYGGDSTCRNAAKFFIDGWTARLHQRGSQAGVYTSSCGGTISDFATIGNVPDAVWPAHWIILSAFWFCENAVSGALW